MYIRKQGNNHTVHNSCTEFCIHLDVTEIENIFRQAIKCTIYATYLLVVYNIFQVSYNSATLINNRDSYRVFTTSDIPNEYIIVHAALHLMD